MNQYDPTYDAGDEYGEELPPRRSFYDEVGLAVGVFLGTIGLIYGSVWYFCS